MEHRGGGGGAAKKKISGRLSIGSTFDAEGIFTWVCMVRINLKFRLFGIPISIRCLI